MNSERLSQTNRRVIRRRTGWQALDLPEVFRYRDLFFLLVSRDVKVLYKQTVLGFGWAVLRPLFAMVIFSVVFGRLAKIPSDGVPYPVFSYAALVPWTYFQTSMTGATNSLIINAPVLTKVYFPRVLIPLAPVASALVDFIIALTIVGVMMAAFGITPSLNIVFLPILVVIMVTTAAAAGLWLSVLGIQYRDVRYAIQFAAQLLMYAAPVVWPASLIPEHYRLVYGLYPMVGVIEGFRSALLSTTPMPWDLIVTGSASAVFFFGSGLVYFRRTERILADVA